MAPTQDHRPPYVRVADALRTAITRGDLPAGARIPSLRELMERYNVSNATAQHAVKILKSEGLLESQVGSGTRVRRPRPMIGVSASYLAPPEGEPWPLWRDEAAKLGMKGAERLGKVRKIKAPDSVAHSLQLEPGAEVVLRPRVMLLDDEPVQLVDSYYPADLADGTPLAQATKIRGGAPSVLAQLGHKPAESAESITAGMPNPDEDKALGGLPAGVPVLRVVRTVTDTEGRPVEVCVMTMDASRHRLEYRLPFHA